MEENNSLFGMEVDHPTSQEMIETTKWIRLFAILLLSITALLVIAFMVGWGTISGLLAEEINLNGMGQDKMVMIVLSIALLMLAAFFGVIVFFLIRGAKRVRAGLLVKNQLLFNQGLGDLKVFFVIYGCLSILGLASSLFTLLQ